MHTTPCRNIQGATELEKPHCKGQHVGSLASFPRLSPQLSFAYGTINAVEGLVKLLRIMTSGGRLEAWHFRWTAALCMHGAISHAFRHPPDVIIRRSFTRPSTALFVLQRMIAAVKAWEQGYWFPMMSVIKGFHCKVPKFKTHWYIVHLSHNEKTSPYL